MSPHFRGHNSRENGNENSLNNQTIDGDEFDIHETSSGAGLRLGGFRYMRPSQLGHSFTTTNQDAEQDSEVHLSQPNLNFRQINATNVEMLESFETAKACKDSGLTSD